MKAGNRTAAITAFTCMTVRELCHCRPCVVVEIVSMRELHSLQDTETELSRGTAAIIDQPEHQCISRDSTLVFRVESL